MPSHIAVIPATTQAGKETIRLLLASETKPFIRAFYRDTSKAPAEFVEDPNFEAVQGDVSKGGFDFGNSDVVYYVPPPTYDGSDSGEFATRAANHVRDAILKGSNVNRLILHSAVGAHHSHGIGILKLNYNSDQILKDVAPEVAILKPGYYYETWAAEAVTTTQENPPRVVSPIAPAEYEFAMVSVKDVAKYSAKFILEKSFKPGLKTFDLFGPRLYSSLHLKQALEKVVGKEVTLEVVEKEDLVGYFEQHVPKTYAEEFADMHIAMLPGGLVAKDFNYDEHTIRGEVELLDALQVMVAH